MKKIGKFELKKNGVGAYMHKAPGNAPVRSTSRVLSQKKEVIAEPSEVDSYTKNLVRQHDSKTGITNYHSKSGKLMASYEAGPKRFTIHPLMSEATNKSDSFEVAFKPFLDHLKKFAHFDITNKPEFQAIVELNSGNKDRLSKSIEPLYKSIYGNFINEIVDTYRGISKDKNLPFSFDKSSDGGIEQMTFTIGGCSLVCKSLGKEMVADLIRQPDSDSGEYALVKGIYYSILSSLYNDPMKYYLRKAELSTEEPLNKATKYESHMKLSGKEKAKMRDVFHGSGTKSRQSTHKISRGVPGSREWDVSQASVKGVHQSTDTFRMPSQVGIPKESKIRYGQRVLNEGKKIKPNLAAMGKSAEVPRHFTVEGRGSWTPLLGGKVLQVGINAERKAAIKVAAQRAEKQKGLKKSRVAGIGGGPRGLASFKRYFQSKLGTKTPGGPGTTKIGAARMLKPTRPALPQWSGGGWKTAMSKSAKNTKGKTLAKAKPAVINPTMPAKFSTKKPT